MKSKSKSLLTQSLLIVFLSVFIALIFNTISRNGIPVIYSPPSIMGTGDIDAGQARQLLVEGRALFIDTRYPEEFSIGHIPGAVNVPQKWSLDQVMAFFESVPKDRLLVVYCGTAECNSSRRLAGFLNQIEYTGVFVFSDGFEIWKVNHYPVEVPGEKDKFTE